MGLGEPESASESRQALSLLARTGHMVRGMDMDTAHDMDTAARDTRMATGTTAEVRDTTIATVTIKPETPGNFSGLFFCRMALQ
jgi:hypothetical protein